MKTVVDLFIAKDRTALFWFTMACAAILCSGIYISKMVGDVSKKPQYVIMDGNGVYYLVPSVEFELATDLHIAQTKLVMETIYNRLPSKLVFEDRVNRLFYKGGIEQLKTELLKDSKKFKEEQREQTIEITDIKVVSVKSSSVVTEGRGILTRRSTYGGREQVETLTVAGRFGWIMNPSMAANGLFPTVCVQILLGDPKKVEE